MKRRHKGHHSKRFSKKKHHTKKKTFKKKYSLFERLCHFSKKHPITIGIILIIASLVLFRLSFTNQFLSKTEIVIWTWLVSGGFFLAGLLVLLAWWRNHVSMFTTRHNVRMR